MARLSDYRRFLSAGYSWRELALNFFRLMIWSRLAGLRYTLAERGRGVVIDYTACIQGGRFIAVGEGSWLQRHVWLTVPLIEMARPPKAPILRVGKRVQLGARCILSAVNSVVIEDDVLFGPNVYVSDHIHAFRDVSRPVKDQGLGNPGMVRVGRGAWIGINAVIVADGKEIVIGEGAVVAAGSLVTKSIPPHSVAAGSPARVIDRYDPETQRWAREREPLT